MLTIKRVYEAPSETDGARFLVERLWPRGIRKEELKLDEWLKSVAPSHELRKWFSHEPDRWEEFQRRYFQELQADPEGWRPIQVALKRGNVTLLFSARDIDHNNALALKIFLERMGD